MLDYAPTYVVAEINLPFHGVIFNGSLVINRGYHCHVPAGTVERAVGIVHTQSVSLGFISASSSYSLRKQMISQYLWRPSNPQL